MHVKELASLVERIDAWDRKWSAELDALSAKAEQTCDYRKYDERRADKGEEADEMLGALVSAVRRHLAEKN